MGPILEFLLLIPVPWLFWVYTGRQGKFSWTKIREEYFYQVLFTELFVTVVIMALIIGLSYWGKGSSGLAIINEARPHHVVTIDSLQKRF